MHEKYSWRFQEFLNWKLRTMCMHIIRFVFIRYGMRYKLCNIVVLTWNLPLWLFSPSIYFNPAWSDIARRLSKTFCLLWVRFVCAYVHVCVYVCLFYYFSFAVACEFFISLRGVTTTTHIHTQKRRNPSNSKPPKIRRHSIYLLLHRALSFKHTA